MIKIDQNQSNGGSRKVMIIGAGVVGLSVAVPLQRRGFHVTIVDELPAGDGASYGNSGFLVPDTAMPSFLPGMLKKVPGWLRDPFGPIALKPGYLPTAMPWLLKYIAAGKLKTVYASSRALRELHRPTFDIWHDLVGASVMQDLVRRDGQLYVWDQPNASPTADIENELRRRNGVEFKVLEQQELRDLLPGISPTANKGLHIPGNGHTINPGRLVKALAGRFLSDGGTIIQERVLKIWPREGSGWTVMTNLANRSTPLLVVATGAWSARLLAPLGIKIPLESERGYHAILPNPSVKLPMAVLHKTGIFGANSMEMGLRLAGTVEFAGLDAAPDERRAQMLVKQVRQMFPAIEHDEPIYWMGHRPSTPDSLPVIGQFSGRDGLFGCFGHGHAGLTGGPASGLLAAQLISGEKPCFTAEPYSPARFGA